MDYKSLEQRISGSFYIFMPKFHGYENDNCTVEEQKNLYDFLNLLFKKLYDDPSLLFPTLHEDYAYPSVFTIVGSNKEYLAPIMKKIKHTIDDIITLLIDIGRNGIFNNEEVKYEQKITKRVKQLLIDLNLKFDDKNIINIGKPFFKALNWFSNNERVKLNQIRFASMSFDPNYDYLTPTLAPYLEKEEGSVSLVVKWLIDNNYYIVDGCDKYQRIDEYIVNYVKDLNNKNEPLGFAYMGDKSHIGFSIQYRYSSINPVFCTLRVQNIKKILEDFSKLSTNMQTFLSKNLKKCNSCNYCIQLDKSRPRAHILVDFDNKKYALCPYYPGFSLSFRDIVIDDAKNFIEFLELNEKYNLK